MPFVIRESPLTFFAIEENEVDVGAVIQFPAAKLAHAQNGEFSAGRACARAQACVAFFVNGGEANSSQT